jgi:KTSC domain
MDLVPVEDADGIIAEVGYNASLRTLEIVFRSGAIYLYYFVPQDVYDALLKPPHHGTYFNQRVKGIFEHHQIAEPYTPDERLQRRRKKRR